eukprot:6424624-Prymnesium_polylepis.1
MASTTTLHLGDRCALHGLKAAQHNGRIGIVRSEEGERRGLVFGDGSTLSVKPHNLKVLPTATLGIVLVGDCSSGRCRDVLAHLLERRDAITCESSADAAYVAVMAVVGPAGSVHADGSYGSCRRAGALHGGLDDQVLRTAMERLSACEGHTRSKGSGYRRLAVTLKASALPSMVVLDLSAGLAAVRHLLGAACSFTLERYGGVCVALNSGGAGPPDPPGADRPSWLRLLSTAVAAEAETADAEPSAAALLAHVRDAWHGKLKPLVPAVLGSTALVDGEVDHREPGAVDLHTCISCLKRAWPDRPLVCGGCLACCYCSTECLLLDMEQHVKQGLCHAAYCPHFAVHRTRPVCVALPTSPRWIEAAMAHRGRYRDECAALEAMGAHKGAYRLFCPCGTDDHSNATGTRSDRSRSETADNILQAEIEIGKIAADIARAAPPRVSAHRLRRGAPRARTHARACSHCVRAVLRSAVAATWPRLGCQASTAACVSSWAEYYVARGIDPASPVALLLTYAMSIYHVICLEGLDTTDRQVGRTAIGASVARQRGLGAAGVACDRHARNPPLSSGHGH